MRTLRIRIYDPARRTWELAGTEEAAQGDWRAAGQAAARRHSVPADYVAVEVDTKVGFVRTTI